MFLQIHAANHLSIRGEQEFSMVAGSGREHAACLLATPDPSTSVLPAAGIYGANASGKSNLFSAVDYLRGAVLSSHRRWSPDGGVPRLPFLLDDQSKAMPSRYEIVFLAGGVRYQYGMAVDDERVLEEWLYAFPRGRRQIWFERDVEEKSVFHFGSHLKGQNRMLARLTRPNSLFLSVAAENNHQQLLVVYEWIRNNLRCSRPEDAPNRLASSVRMLEQEHSRSRLLSLMRTADLGILDVAVVEKELPGDAQEFVSAIREAVANRRKSLTIETSPSKEARFMHRSSGESGKTPLPFGVESRGTTAFFALLSPVLNSLENGWSLFFDELDTSLHPLLAAHVISLYQNPATNPRCAQLIFNTHDITLLTSAASPTPLRRDQVWFSEKDDAGATHYYSLTDFSPRKTENVARGYLHGRYGAIPLLRTDLGSSFVSTQEDRNGTAAP